jgi:hypothetical protein
MALRQTLEVLNGMVTAAVIDTYAIGGAVAAFYYIEASSTDDLDILVSFEDVNESQSGLVTLGPIISYLAARGYTEWRAEGIVIEGWPVQFLPVADALDADMLAAATDIELEVETGAPPVATRILSAEHVIANAVRIGRPKDINRIAQFIEEAAYNFDSLRVILENHQLVAKWNIICGRLGIEERRI